MKRWAPSIFCVMVLVPLYLISRPPSISSSTGERLASQFSFARYQLQDINTTQPEHIRRMHPSIDHFAAWMSFVGGAVSIGDLDNDGLANDLVLVDPRYNTVTVCPVPSTGDRYPPFLIDLQRLASMTHAVAPMGTRLGDFNEDGLTDLLIYFWGRSPALLLKQPETLSNDAFDFQELVEPCQVWHTSCVTQADLDGDGHVDLVIGNYNPDNAKTLDYMDVSGTEYMMGSWARAKNGGTSRLMMHQPDASGSLFREAEGALSDAVADGWAFACAAGDLDGDLLPEIYWVHDWGADCLLHNRSTPGSPKFVELHGKRSLLTPRSLAVGLDTFNGMGVDFGDLNQDGHLDMMISNITCDFGLHQSNLVHIGTGQFADMSQGIAPFENQSEALGLSRGGWAWDTKFGDFDNDGTLEVLQATGFFKGTINRWPELHEMALANEELAKRPEIYPRLGNDDDVAGHEHNPFFVRHGDRYFDIAPYMTQSGLNQPMLSRGIAMADVDRDGDLDFAYGNQWEDSFFYLNTRPAHADYLGLDLRLVLDDSKLIGPQGYAISVGALPDDLRTLPAIGAHARLKIGNAPQQRVYVGQVDGGNGHSGQRAPELLFGLGEGADELPLTVEIEWRDREGHVRQASLEDLQPGWHTVLLGQPSSPARATPAARVSTR